jgi:hypothetical protein
MGHGLMELMSPHQAVLLPARSSQTHEASKPEGAFGMRHFSPLAYNDTMGSKQRKWFPPVRLCDLHTLETHSP